MTCSVFKYELTNECIQTLRVPEGTSPLSVGTQNRTMCLWAITPLSGPEHDATVLLIPTGAIVPEDIDSYVLVGRITLTHERLTFPPLLGYYEFHVFYKGL